MSDRTPSELGGAYSWIDGPDGSWLQFNAGCAAYVKRVGESGDFAVVIHWRKREIRGTAASIAQGKRFITRWIRARSSAKYRRPSKVAPAKRTLPGIPELLRKQPPASRTRIVPRGPEFDLEAELPPLPTMEDFLAALDAAKRFQSQPAGHARREPRPRRRNWDWSV